MAIYIIPEIGAKGKFLFKAPFSNNTTAATEFECMSVRTLTDIVKNQEFFITKGLGSPPVWFVEVRIENVERYDRKVDVRD